MRFALENIFDVLKLSNGQVDRQIELVVGQAVDRPQGIAEAGVRHITPIGVILFDELRALIDQINPLGQFACTGARWERGGGGVGMEEKMLELAICLVWG